MSSEKQEQVIQASEIIERFGGIRPMAKKMGVAVTTIQGWKKRDAIPPTRVDAVKEAANANAVDLSGLLGQSESAAEDTVIEVRETVTVSEDSVDLERVESVTTQPHKDEEPLADFSADLKSSQERLEALVAEAQAANDEPVTERTTSFSDNIDIKPQVRSDLHKRLSELEKKAIRKSTWINFILIVFVLCGVGILLLFTQKEQKQDQVRIDSLESDLGSLKSDINAVKEQQSFLNTLIPKDLDHRIEQIQEQAVTAQQKVNEALAVAGGVSNDLLAGNGEKAVAEMEKMAGLISEVSEDFNVEGLLGQYASMGQSLEGQAVIDQAMAQISAVLAAAQGNEEITEEQALQVAAQNSPEIEETLKGVPAAEMKAAVALLALTQFRSSLYRDNQPFQDDLAVLKSLIGDSDPAMSAAIDKLAPTAEEGVLSPAGLQKEFSTLAGDAVVASLKGEDVSLQEKFSAKFNEVLQIEEDGELITGTETQATLDKTEKMLKDGNVQGALETLDTLDPSVQAVFSDWMKKAQKSVSAASLERDVRTNIEQLLGQAVEDYLPGAGEGASHRFYLR